MQLVVVLAALVASTGIGCSSEAVSKKGSTLRHVLTMHSFARQALGRAPRDEGEFRAFIENQGAKVLESLDIASADDLLVSSRDGKPYVIVYGKPPAAGIVAYEAEGVDGVREVGYDIGKVDRLDETEFAALGL